MAKTILIVVVIAIAAVLLGVAFSPDSFRIERSTTINASPEKVFALIEDMHKWAMWSPYERMDPDMKKTFSGPGKGVGAAYEWESKKAGTGRMEILKTTPGVDVVIKLDFRRPMTAHSTCDFTIKKNGKSCDVTWAMYGHQSYNAKLAHLFFNMDKMVGKDFEAGLMALKAAAEKK